MNVEHFHSCRLYFLGYSGMKHPGIMLVLSSFLSPVNTLSKHSQLVLTESADKQLRRIVESVGEGVTEFEKGDHVLTMFTGECMNCKQCKSNKSNVCSVLGLERRGLMHSDQKTRFSVKGRPVYHYCAVSSFSEYTVVHSGCAVKVDPRAPLEKICLLSCGVAAGK